MAYVFGAKIIVVFYVKTEINFSCPFLMDSVQQHQVYEVILRQGSLLFSIALSLGIPDTY